MTSFTNSSQILHKMTQHFKTTDDWFEAYHLHEIARKQEDARRHQEKLNEARAALKAHIKAHVQQWQQDFTTKNLHIKLNFEDVFGDASNSLVHVWHLVTTPDEALNCFYAVASPSGETTEWYVKYQELRSQSTHEYISWLIVNIVPKGSAKN